MRIVGYDQVPSVIPVPPVGRGLTREQRLRRRIGRTLAGARLRRGGQLPVRRRRRPSTRSGCPRTTCCGTPSGCPTRCPQEKPLYTTTLLPGRPRRGCAQPRPRRDRGRAVRDRHRRLPDRPRPGSRVRRRLAADRGRAGRSCSRRSRSSRCSWPSVLSGERERAGWWGEGRPADWSDAIEVVRDARPRARRRGRGRADVPDAVAPEPLRAACSVDGQEFGHAGELHPRVCRTFGLPPRHRGARDRPRLPDGADASRSRTAPVVLAPPGGQGGRRAGGRRRRSAPSRSSRPCAPAPASCSRASGSSTSTPARRSARARSRSPSPSASGPPTARSPRPRRAPPATPPSPPRPPPSAPSSADSAQTVSELTPSRR